MKRKFLFLTMILLILLLFISSTKDSPISNMVYVEGGTFKMGDTFGDGESDEKPAHEVSVGSFWIGKYEVTKKEWIDVMGNYTSEYYRAGDNYPVYYVSWYDAIEFCNKKSIKERLNQYYNIKNESVTINEGANGYRLPTEAEWEYSARGGTQSDNFNYSGSDNVDEIAWYIKTTKDKGTQQVGTKNPNELGIYDMSGNVWEMCWDLYDRYPGNNYKDAYHFYGTDYRVMRGGSWADSPNSLRVAGRDYIYPANGYSTIGFRIARTY